MITKKIAQLLEVAFQVSGMTPSRGVVDWYIAELERMDPAVATRALERFVRDPQGKRLTIGLLEDLGSGNRTASDAALEAPGWILSLIERYGMPNERDARKAAGPELWKVIELVGGWRSLCETPSYDNWATIAAQIREVAKSAYRRMAAGGLDAIDTKNRGRISEGGDVAMAVIKDLEAGR